MSEIQFDIEDCMFGDGSHAIHIAEAFDSKELAEKFANQIKSALKLQELVKGRIKELPDEDESWETCKPRIKYELKSLVEQSENSVQDDGS